MPKEVLLYGGIESYTAKEFHDALQKVEGTDELILRINSSGGSPEYGWGIISMWNEIKTSKKIRVDGQAHSTAAFLLCYTDYTESLDVAEFLIHRAAYPEWMERSEDFDEATKGNLVRVNASMEKAFREKVDVAKFEALPQMAGKKIKDIFSMDSRIDIYLTAKEAKSIGLINKVISLTPTITAEIKKYAKAASSGGGIFIPKEAEKEENKTNSIKMTIENLKTEHPEVFAQAVKQGVNAERDRVGAWMAFNDIDAAAVAKGIKDGESLSATASAEFARKAYSKGAIKSAEEESPKDIETQEVKDAKTAEKVAAEKKVTDFTNAAKEAAKKLTA